MRTKLGLLTCLCFVMVVSDSNARRLLIDVVDNRNRSNFRMKPTNARVGQSRPQLVLDPEGEGIMVATMLQIKNVRIS